tara:strand:- start:58 stop:1860 length:1803 start_codon:yes stop_codon:yes gene_type:complete
MSLAKQITKAFVKMVKDSDRVQKSVDVMKGKLIKESLGVLDKAGIDMASLPFDPIALLNGDIPNPTTLLTPENICSVPSLSDSQKNQANIAIDRVSNTLEGIIENTNKLKSALIAIQTPIAGIRVTGETTLTLANTLSNVIKLIKAIPIPTAFGAPAVALPVKVLTILSSTLIKLDKKVDIAKGTISLIPTMINQISGILNSTIAAVNGVEGLIQGVLVLLSAIKSVVELGDTCPAVTQGEIDDVTSSVNDTLQNALDSSGDNSLLELNQISEADLLASFPFDYNGFLLQLVNNPNNGYINEITNDETGVITEEFVQFPFPSRRIRGSRDFSSNDGGTGERSTIFVLNNKFNEAVGEVILYNDPGGQGRYSYSTSVSILVEEMKYKIDNYLLGIKEIVLPAYRPPAITGSAPPVDIDRGTIRGTEIGTGGGNPNATGIYVPPPPPIDPLSPPFANLQSDTVPGFGAVGRIDNGLFENNTVLALPFSTWIVGAFVATRPIKLRMTTFGGTSTAGTYTNAILRLYKTSGAEGSVAYDFINEEQRADYGDTVEEVFDVVGGGYNNTGTQQSDTGIFYFEIRITSVAPYQGFPNNFTQFAIEAQ